MPTKQPLLRKCLGYALLLGSASTALLPSSRAQDKAHPVFTKLYKQMQQKHTLLCVGLDPDLRKLPQEILKKNIRDEEKIRLFLQSVVQLTAEHACAYKINKAFFDRYQQGHQLLKEVCRYIQTHHPDIPIFVDCKIGDIDNTMEQYMHLLFQELAVDGVVVSPYMGDSVFTHLPADKVAIVLVQTSNKDGAVTQKVRLRNGKQYWEYILDLTIRTDRWNKHKNLIPVLSANAAADDDYSTIRQRIGEATPILLAGMGAQGGHQAKLARLLNQDRIGVFINSSRGILYPYKKKDQRTQQWKDKRRDWRAAIRQAAIRSKTAFNKARGPARAAQPKPPKQGIFVLLLGPSGAGKTTIIHKLKALDSRITYIAPLTTRKLRPGEQDKKQASKRKITLLKQQGQLLKVNRIRDILYATPKAPIERTRKQGGIAILDWPVDEMQVMLDHYKGILLVFYIDPSDLKTLQHRLTQTGRDKDGQRLADGRKELAAYKQGAFDAYIDHKVVNKAGDIEATVAHIYAKIIAFYNEKNK